VVVLSTPRWAVLAAYGAVLSVLPSAAWRTAIGFGADLGTSPAWREFQQVPGPGTVYMLTLSLLSIGAALLTLGLVQPWGEWVPRGVPVLGGRRVPTAAALIPAVAGAVLVVAIGVASVINWERIIGFAGRPTPGWYELAVAAYLPTLLWGPFVLIAAYGYWRRRSSD
jgi:hypothetical protein